MRGARSVRARFRLPGDAANAVTTERAVLGRETRRCLPECSANLTELQHTPLQ